MSIIERARHWIDKGTYKEPSPSTDNVRVARLEVDDATTYVDKDGSDNITLTDAVTGTKTLAQLSAAGSGDVTGPASSTDHAIARYDSTTGKILLNSGVTIDDSGNVVTATSIKAAYMIIGESEFGYDADANTGIISLTLAGQPILSSDIGDVSLLTSLTKLDDLAAPDDNTDLDATDALHGLFAKLDKGKLDTIDTNADVTADNAPKAHEASHQVGGGDILYVPRTYVWFVKGTVAVGTEQGATFRIKRATTVEDVELHVKTAPTGAALIVDINDGGTTIFSTEPEIDIDGTTEDDNHVISDTALAATTELTMDVVQVGSTIAGADLTVLLHCLEAVA